MRRQEGEKGKKKKMKESQEADIGSFLHQVWPFYLSLKGL